MDLDALEDALFGNEITGTEVAVAVLLLLLGALGYYLSERSFAGHSEGPSRQPRNSPKS